MKLATVFSLLCLSSSAHAQSTLTMDARHSTVGDLELNPADEMILLDGESQVQKMDVEMNRSSAADVASEFDSELDNRDAPAVSKLMFKVGPGFSSLSTYNKTDDATKRDRTGLFVSAEFEMPLSSDFSFVSGLNYVQKGMDRYDATGLFSSRLNYLLVPALGRFNFRLNDQHAIAFSIGPYAALAISRSNSFVASNGQVSQESAESVSNLDFGGRFAFDYEMQVRSNLSFLVGAGYDLGFWNLGYNVAPDSNTTRAFMVGVGMAMKL